MIYGLIIGREGSKGYPNKNIVEVLGRPIMSYPIIEARNSKYVNKIFLSTDSSTIGMIGEKYEAVLIERPPELCNDEALGEDAYKHGYFWIKDNVCQNIELMVLLHCNAVTVTTELIDKGIEILRGNPDLDSAVSVSKYNMWSPLRARKINDDGLLDPFVPFETFGDPKTLNCDRDSQGDVWFADMALSIVRPSCLENLEEGLLPQKWMGRRIYPLKQEGGFDIDYEWQLPMLEYWLKTYGRYG